MSMKEIVIVALATLLLIPMACSRQEDYHE